MSPTGRGRSWRPRGDGGFTRVIDDIGQHLWATLLCVVGVALIFGVVWWVSKW